MQKKVFIIIIIIAWGSIPTFKPLITSIIKI